MKQEQEQEKKEKINPRKVQELKPGKNGERQFLLKFPRKKKQMEEKVQVREIRVTILGPERLEDVNADNFDKKGLDRPVSRQCGGSGHHTIFVSPEKSGDEACKDLLASFVLRCRRGDITIISED